MLEDHRRVVPGEPWSSSSTTPIATWSTTTWASAFDVQAFLPEGVVVAESKVLFDKKSIDRLDDKAELAAKSTKTPKSCP